MSLPLLEMALIWFFPHLYRLCYILGTDFSYEFEGLSPTIGFA